jgi:hypothetical protein
MGAKIRLYGARCRADRPSTDRRRAAVPAKNPRKQGVARCWKRSATPCLPATLLRVVRLISLRIYACVADEREAIHAQTSEIER